MRAKLSFIIIILASLIIPLISAFNWGYGYSSPLDYLENEWVLFGIVFIILFWVIAGFIKRKTDNVPTSVIVGGGLSLLLTIPIMKRGLLDNFLQESIVDWILIIALIIGFLFVVYWLYKKWTWKGVLLGLFLLGLIPVFVDLEGILPDDIYYGPVGDFIEVIQGFSDIIIIGVIGYVIILIIWKIKGGGGQASSYSGAPEQSQQSQRQTAQFGANRARRLMELNRRYKYFINRNKNLNTSQAQVQVTKYQKKIAELQKKANKIGITLP